MAFLTVLSRMNQEETMGFSIFTDTSANVPTPLTREHEIGVIPLSYIAEGQEHVCLDTESFRCQEYYTALKEGAKITTSQINPQKYAEYMEPALQAGSDILFVGMSSGISGSFHSAQLAAEQLLETYEDRKILLVDSLGASLGEGMLVLEAVSCREKGMSLQETADYLLELRDHVYQLFTVDDLMFLRRGGRLSNASALVGTVLNVKPILKGNELGKIVTFEKVRGRKKVMDKIAARYDLLVRNAGEQTVCISHGNCPEDANLLADMIRRNNPPRDVLIVEHEPVTGSYLGPGALCIYFRGEKDVRLK